MACDCLEYTCLLPAPAILQCGEDITTNLVVPTTGMWLMQYEFNGTWQGVMIDAVQGTLLTIPNVFNENYTHAIKFYNASGELIGDKCYSLDTRTLIRINTGGTSPVQPVNPAFTTVTAEAGSTIPFTFGEPIIIYVEAQSYYNGFTWNGSEIEFTNGVAFYDGQEIGIMYI